MGELCVLTGDDNQSGMDKDIHYMSYFDVFAHHRWRIIIGTVVAFVVMFVWCGLGIPPMKKKWKGTVGIIYPLQKSSLAIKRTLGSLDIPLGGLGGLIGGAQTAYNNIPVLESRRVLVRTVEKVPGVREKLDPEGKMDEAGLAKGLKKTIKVDDSQDGYLEISVLWPDKKIAANIANALVEEMKKALEELNKESSHFMSNFMKERIASVEEKMGKADKAVRDFKEQSKILAVEDQAIEMIKTYSQLQLDLSQAEMDFAEAVTRHKLLNQEKIDLAEYIKANVPEKDIFDLARIQEDPVISKQESSVVIEKVPPAEALKDEGVGKLRKDISDLQLELDRKKLLYTDDHPEIISLRKKLYDAKRSLYQELENYTRSAELSLDIDRLAYQAKRDVIVSMAKDLDDKMTKFPADEAQLVRLIRDQKVYEEVYSLLMQEYEQSLLAEERPETTFQILDPAVPINRPARPRTMPYSMGFAFIVFAVLLMSSFYSDRKRIK